MDPTAQINTGPMPGSAGQVITQQVNQKKGKLIVIFIVVLILVIAIAVGLYLFNFVVKPQQTTANLTGEAVTDSMVGFNRFQELKTQGGSIVSSAAYQIIYRGTLTDFTDSSWSLESAGNKLVINQEVPQNLAYSIVLGDGIQKTIPPTELKVGDQVSIATSIDPITGKVTINSVRVLRKADVVAVPPSPKPEDLLPPSTPPAN